MEEVRVKNDAMPADEAHEVENPLEMTRVEDEEALTARQPKNWIVKKLSNLRRVQLK